MLWNFRNILSLRIIEVEPRDGGGILMGHGIEMITIALDTVFQRVQLFIFFLEEAPPPQLLVLQ